MKTVGAGSWQLFEERSDGLFTPVTERYSEGVATINIQVVDADLQPVDGARVLLAIFENSPRFDCEAYSDNNGMVSFAVGEGRDYRARTEAAFGIYPPIAGTTRSSSSSVRGDLSYQFQIAAPLPQASIETLLPEDPVQDYMFTANMVSTGYYITGKSLGRYRCVGNQTPPLQVFLRTSHGQAVGHGCR